MEIFNKNNHLLLIFIKVAENLKGSLQSKSNINNIIHIFDNLFFPFSVKKETDFFYVPNGKKFGHFIQALKEENVLRETDHF